MNTPVSKSGQASLLISALLRPACYPHATDKIERLETHISWVFLAGPYAYKLKKPVALEFLDFSTLEARRHHCEEELRLNRRLAPDLYLDVVEICGSHDAPRVGGEGPVIEYAVRMRRFAQEALASQVLARGDLTPQLVTGLASRIARFHGSLIPAQAEPYGTPESVLHNAVQNFEQIERLLDKRVDRETPQVIHEWTEREFWSIYGDIRNRRALGMVRECHGDLHLGNIVLIDAELVPFDCIEFNADLRWSDVMSEVAFLMMDLVDRGAPRLAWLFLNTYLEATGDYSGLAVLRFYLTSRAVVRAKVHLIRARQTASDPAEEARLVRAYRGYMELAAHFAHAGQPALLLMHGLAASGKSTIAQELAQAWGAIRVRSDVERKRLHGMGALQRSGSAVASGLYGQDSTQATYARLAEIARVIVGTGHKVIVDATFLQQWQRAQLREVAQTLAVPIAVLSVQAPESVLRQRIEARRAHAMDPSEATVSVLQYQRGTQQSISAEERLPVITVNGCQDAAPSLVADIARVFAGYPRSVVASPVEQRGPKIAETSL